MSRVYIHWSPSSPLNRDQAYDARDSLAKNVYSKIFDWIVKKINTTVETSKSDFSIGVLDIFGFEILEVGAVMFCVENGGRVFAALVLTIQM